MNQTVNGFRMTELPDQSSTSMPAVSPALAAVRMAASKWLEQNGDVPVAWTALVNETGAEHGRRVVEILGELNADSMTCAMAMISCANRIPDDAEWLMEFMDMKIHDIRETEVISRELSALVIQAVRVLSLETVQFETRSAMGDSVRRRTQLERIRRLVLALAADVRVVMVRLASGLAVMRSLVRIARSDTGRALESRAGSVALEARQVLAPLASRLGLYRLKWELEDTAFELLEPDQYDRLKRSMEASRADDLLTIEALQRHLRAELAARGVRADISGRRKHLYSLAVKMRQKERNLAGIHDVLAMRIIVDTIPDCYAALDVVHATWNPLIGEFNDYIMKPKPNGYQSLHTIVMAGADVPMYPAMDFEVQIRTTEMHRLAEHGVAAHWRYKEGRAGDRQTAPDRVAWLRQLIAWQQSVGDQLAAGGGSTIDDEHVYVVSPQGRIVDLPAGSTPVDFAYRIHTSLGHRCRGALVDGRLVPLNTKLSNGELVEILQARAAPGLEPGPSRDWLKPEAGYIGSPSTRVKIRQWFAKQEQDLTLARGRERVEKVLARGGRSSQSMAALAQTLGFPDVGAMWQAAAHEQLASRQIEGALQRLETGEPSGPTAGRRPAEEPGTAGSGPSGPSPERSGAVLVHGVDFLMTQLARCCHPIPHDAIAGFVTRGRGISVHRLECTALAALRLRSPERVLEAAWSETGSHSVAGNKAPGGLSPNRTYPVALRVEAGDRPGLFRDIADVLARDRINLQSVRSHARDGLAQLQLVLAVADSAELALIAGKIRSVTDVARIERL